VRQGSDVVEMQLIKVVVREQQQEAIMVQIRLKCKNAAGMEGEQRL